MKESNELFELCKQVFKSTGWDAQDNYWSYDGSYLVDKDRMTSIEFQTAVIPYYTSDYLVDKLPATVKNDFDGGNDYIILYKKGKSWYADYMGQFKRQKSDTPLKALLKLTLKLHEEGLL